MISNDRLPHYGSMSGIHPRAKKIIWLQKKLHIDGEDATMAIKIGTFAQREAFVDQLPDAICYDGYEGLEEAFSEWLAQERNRGFKPKK
ncbi:hypothetical protein [Spirosoma foliorum]|uniref:Uncharacterized protein n=1 Tax=Spirosoma foliorum TaxID=2710596 RepID=A0A7G5H2P2_9BACT|nr:hypothetical protein [Spirosoma foliorum]QMW05384.1 hypothetical protein H3H32_11070 [Spirosoma foliorum]